ncbi:MAG: TonB-dependent receptor plug domain-containing protein [Acidobacteria bacterium]|nr:TonB-dependent receptor plug domain-containing protein [Acidobacteriota bacterium]
MSRTICNVFALALCAATASVDALAQSTADGITHGVRITGTVQTPDGSRLPGATVRIFGTPLITATDGNGNYVLEATRPPGRLILFAELPNFTSDDATLQVTGPLSTRIDFVLTPTFASDVTVIAEVPMLDATDDISRIELAPEQVSVLPSLGERDLFRAFQLLPGVSGSNEASSGLYVRGGTPDQNRVEYDGFRVYHVDHLFGYFSAFNMDAVDTVELSKGGYEARHGGALSSVMQITGKSGRLDRAAGSFGAGLLSFNGVYETPLFNNRGSGLLAVRRSFQGPLYDKILNLYDNSPVPGRPGGGGFGPGSGRFSTFSSQPSSSFYDVNGKLLFNPSGSDEVSVSLYRGNDNLDNSRSLQVPEGLFERLLARGIDPAERGLDLNSTLDITDVRDSGNTGVGLVWSRQWNSSVLSEVSLGYSRFQDVRDRARQIGSNANPSAESNLVDDLTFKATVPITLGVGHTFEGGVEVTGNRLSYSLQSGQGQGARLGASPLASVLHRDEGGRLAAAFLQDRWLIGSRLLLVPGVRLTHFDRTGGRYTEPRLAATLFVTDTFKLKTAAGRYHQFTNRITREDVLQGNREFWSLSDGTTVPVAEATHLIGGASYERGDLLVDVELFTKDLTDLTQFAPRFATASDDLDYDAFFYRGTGTARGGELLVQKRSGRHTGWASYTLSAVEESFPDLQAAPFPATHDQRHEVKLVNLYQMGDWHLSQTWIYASGKPYTEPIGLETVDRPFGGTIDRVVAGPKNGGRLPAYHRMDVAINREFYVQNSMRGVFSVTLFNLYNRTNVWYKEFEVIENEIIENDIQLMGRTVNAAVTLKF